MKKKLTLTMSKDVKYIAMEVRHKKNKSISKIVEELVKEEYDKLEKIDGNNKKEKITLTISEESKHMIDVLHSVKGMSISKLLEDYILKEYSEMNRK